MWPTGVLLLGCVVVVSSGGFGGPHIEEIRQKINSASVCLQRLVDCSAVYEPIAVGEINGSLFYDPKDLDKACSKNAEYIECLENTQSFCVMENIGATEITMIRNRLWIRDLCEEGSTWRRVYRRHSYCIIRESFEHTTYCTRRQTPVHPRHVSLADLCRLFKGTVECIEEVLRHKCGPQAADLFYRVSLMKGNREYLCEERKVHHPREESASLKAAKQMLRNVRSLMANMSSIVKATLGEEEAGYILQDMDPQEIQRIKDLFKMKGGIKYGEPPLFEMKDLIDDEDEEEQPQDEYIQIIEVHTPKKAKSVIKDIKSQEEEGIAGQEGLYAQDWSRRLDKHYKSNEIDWPEESSFDDASMHPIHATDEEESLYPVEKDGMAYSEDESMHPVQDTEEIDYPEESLHLTQEGEVDYSKESFKETEYPDDWTDARPQSHFSQEIDDYQCAEEDCNEPQSHPVRNEIEYSDPTSSMDGSLQLSIFDKSEDAEVEDMNSVLSENVNSDKVLWKMDEDYSCNRLDKRLPEEFKSNASFHVYAVRNRGSMTHMGSGLTMAPWKTVTDAPLDDLFCSWLDPSTSRTLFKCTIKLTELADYTEQGRKRPRTHPILLALYTSPASSAAEVVSMSEVATICVEDFQPAEEISVEQSSVDSLQPVNSKLKEFMHDEDSHRNSQVADAAILENSEFAGCSLEKLHSKASVQRRSLDTVKVDGTSNDETDSFCSLEKLEDKYSIKKRALDMAHEENEVSDAFDRNLSLIFVEELPEHIRDVDEKFGLLHDQKLSQPNWKRRSSSCQILDEVSTKDCQIPDVSSEEGCQIPEKNSMKEDCQLDEDSSDQPILTDTASSFVKSSDSPTNLPEITNSETANFAEEPDNPQNTDVLTDCKNGKIQTLVGTAIKPGLYAEVTNLETIHPLNLKFGTGCRFAENVNYILVEEPYHRSKSTLADSESSYLVQPEIKVIRSVNGFIGR